MILLFAPKQCSAKDDQISGEAKLSYIFLEQSGDRHSLPELYNTYSGFSLDKLYLAGRFKTNSTFQVNLRNPNLDNRDLTLDLTMPDVLSFRAKHRRSRFVFDEDGDIRSFRTHTDLRSTFKPASFLKLILGYAHRLKEGSRLGLIENNRGVLGEKYDQKIQRGEAGVQMKWGRRYVTVSHRILLFDKEQQDSLDRKSNTTEISLNAPLPGNISAFLKYVRGESVLEKNELKLKTDLFAGTVFQRISKKILIGGKFSFQRSDDLSTYRMTDIGRVGFSVDYLINKKFETDVGYEYYIKEDQFGEISTHSFLLGAKVSPADNLSLRGLYRFRMRKDPDLATLIGEYDQDNKLLKVKYRPLEKINLQIRYQDKTRENSDINTKAEMRGFSSNAHFDLGKAFDLTLSFNLLDRDFQNSITHFRSSNRIYGLVINSRLMKSLNLRSDVDYLDLSKDLDISKFTFSLNLIYEFLDDYGVEFAFRRFTYDDMILSENDFDANIFKIGVSRKIKGLK
jgi:hypothetical protein